MAKQDSIRELQRLVIKEELYILTGDHYKAVLLNTLIFWHGIVEKSDKNLQRRIKNLEENNAKQSTINSLKRKVRNGWFFKTAEELTQELMGWGSPSKITRAMQHFEEKGWIQKGNNPDPRAKWDRTNWYRVNIKNIAKDLKELGYALEGYSLLQDEQEIPEVEEEPIEQEIPEVEEDSKKKIKITDAELNKLVRENDFINTLLWFFDSKKFLNNKRDFKAVVQKLYELDCTIFQLDDIMNAYFIVKEKIAYGIVKSHPAHYFATVLSNEVEKSKIKKQYEQDKLKHSSSNRSEPNRELLNYNWLENNDEVSNF